MGNEAEETKRFIVDNDRLPALYPTHRHPAQFWEHLGRVVATFGFLEEILKRAIFAFTAPRRHGSLEEYEAACDAWLLQLKQALTDQLWSLAVKYGKAVRNNPDSTVNVDKLVRDIKEATTLRNALCHGSWRIPDEVGKSLPLFITKKHKKFDTPIDIEFLRTVQRDVAELACDVVASVVDMGWQFPGRPGPGKTIWPPKPCH